MPDPGSQRRHIGVIGAGIAGATVAYRLAKFGFKVSVFEAQRAGCGGSGNPSAVLYPKLVKAEHMPSHVQSHAFLRALDELSAPELSASFKQTGVLWLDAPDRLHTIAYNHPWLDKDLWLLNADQASDCAGTRLAHGGLWIPRAGLIDTQKLLSALLADPNITLQEGCEVIAYSAQARGWSLQTTGQTYAVDELVLANAGDARRFLPELAAPIRPIRGQVTLIAEQTELPLKCSICYGGYVGMPQAGYYSIGATFQRDDTDTQVRHTDHQANWQELVRYVPEMANLSELAMLHGRASLRWQSSDYLPLAGPIDEGLIEFLRLHSPKKHRPEYKASASCKPLYVSIGHGAKGYSQAWLAADIIADALTGQPSRHGEDITAALSAERFIWRAWQRGKLWRPDATTR